MIKERFIHIVSIVIEVMKMISIFEDKSKFLERYEPYFRTNEVSCSLIWGITKKVKHLELMISAHRDRAFVLGVLAGKNLIIQANTIDEDLYKELVSYMEKIPYPGIVGSKESCLCYHKIYKKLTGKDMKITMNQRIYSCNQTHPVSLSIGKVRLASKDDFSVLSEWAYAFSKEIGEDTDMEQARKSVSNLIENKGLYVLELNNEIVSMTGRIRALKYTESIGYVYTPRKHRGKGYASKLVQAVTQMVIDEGKTAVLYTDLSNPTSNHIYIDIGYKPYIDSMMMNKNE
jgi:hypothetical protein